MFRKDEAGSSEEAGPLDYILEFPHVAGPMVAQEAIQGLGGDFLAVVSGVEAKEMVHQERNVLLTLSERRKRNGHDIQPVKEIFPENPSRHQGV
jgi:hypothetical protein